MKRRILRTKAFTLIETLLYSGLVMVVIGTIIMASLSLFDSYDHDRERQAVLENITCIDQKVDWALTGATAVTPTSGSGSSMAMVRADGQMVSFEKQGAALSLATDSNGDSSITVGDVRYSLTNSHVTVTDVIFTRSLVNSQSVMTLTLQLAGRYGSQTVTKQVVLQ